MKYWLDNQYDDSFNNNDDMVLQVRNIVQDLCHFCSFVTLQEDNNFNFDFSNKAPVTDSISVDAQFELARAKLKVSLVQELKAYLLEENCKGNPLEWWRQNCFRFPNIARVARKWLAVTATSTPSERVFSICGHVDSCKRSQMLGESIEAQVFVHNNYYECHNLTG